MAAEILGLKLVPARTAGYDALRGKERIQIKGRAYGEKASKSQPISKIKLGAPYDTMLRSTMQHWRRARCWKRPTPPSVSTWPSPARKQENPAPWESRRSGRSHDASGKVRLEARPKQVRGCLDEIVSELLNAADNVECERFNKDTQLTATLLLLMRMVSLIPPLLLLLRLPSDDPYLRSGP